MTDPGQVMRRLADIENDLAVRQNAYEQAARNWIIAKRDKERHRAEVFLTTDGTVAERSAHADKATAMTQENRLLLALEKAGRRGLTSADFSGVRGTPDGLGPMPRFARALNRLRDRGIEIEDVRDAGGKIVKRDGCNVVRLVSKLEPLPVLEPDERLFMPPPVDAIRGEAA